MDMNTLFQRFLLLIPLWLSLTVHEWAHAFSAYKLGDDTAKASGRLTLNPAAHIDPIGTLLLPLMGVPFGWARPVPINPLRFTSRLQMKTGMLITAAAGPLANIVMAVVSTLTVVILVRVVHFDFQSNISVFMFLNNLILINVILAIFNMLPIPPLDGSRVADALVPEFLRPVWDRFLRLGPLALIGVILLPLLFNVSILEWPVRFVLSILQRLLAM